MPFYLIYKCSLYCNAGACVVNLAILITAGSARYDDYGEYCAENEQRLIEDSDTTFADHGAQIQNLFITQCILGVIF